MTQEILDEQEVLRRCDATTDPFCVRAELVVWSAGCAIGMLIGVLLVVSGFFNVGEDIADATVRVVFGLAVIGFCGVLVRCKYVELRKKFDADDTLDTKAVEYEWRRFRQQLAELSSQERGGDDGQSRIG